MDDRQRKIELWTKVAGAVIAFLMCAVLVVLSVQGMRRRGELARQSSSPGIQAIDPALIRWTEVQRFNTGLRVARGIAVADDGLYVAGDSATVRFDANGKRQASRPLDESPSCLAIAGDGTVLVATRKTITVFTKGWKRAARWIVPGQQACLTSLAISGNDVWAADAGARVVYHYDHSGKLLGRIGKKDARRGIPGLLAPSPHLDVAAAKDGMVWVANPGRHRMEHYAKDGRLISAWGKAGMAVEGFSGCCNPTDFALLPDGRIVTAEKRVKRVKVYRTDGTLDAVVAGPDTFCKKNGALDVAVDGQGSIYVLDRGDGTVHVYTKK